MKPSLKFLMSSVMIALTFSAPQAIQGIEDFSKLGEDIQKSHRVSISSDTTEETQHKKREHEEIEKNPFEGYPEELTFMILERAAIANYLSDGNTGSLKLVCKDWRRIMAGDHIKKSVESVKQEYIYQRFLKGVLIYRPQEGSDAGKIVLPISTLGNPLEGTFDLSRCGDMGKYLSISTGYKKRKKEENASKVEIWFTPRFLIEKELNTTAKHFQAIFPAKWNANAPVGIFWTWGGWDDLSWMDYLTTQNMDNLSKIDLYENWKKSKMTAHDTHIVSAGWEWPGDGVVGARFHVSFVTAT